MSTLPYLSAADVRAALPIPAAMDALDAALLERGDGTPRVNPEADGPRLFSPAPDGEFLLMPAQGSPFSGLKALTVAPNNPDRGLEKIQGLYILFDSHTLSPLAIFEGASLTAIRTPAVTLSAMRGLARAAAPGTEVSAQPELLVFGAGVQAASHIEAAVQTFPGVRVRVAGRRADRVADLINTLREQPITADTDFAAVTPESLDAAVASADLIICVTSASTALFDGDLVRNNAIVAAAGTHGLERRELDDALIARADVVVEGRGSAQRENGNLVSIDEARWADANRAPANLADLANGRVARRANHPAVYTGVGMSWEDLVCATALYEAACDPVSRREDRP